MVHKPLEFLYERFTAYIEDRRREPRDDVMTELATATFPDGSLPEVHDVMLIAANLFAAGEETTARLLGTMLRLHRRAPRAPAAAARRPRRSSRPSSRRRCGSRARSRASSGCRASPTTIGGVDLPAGTTVMVLNGAANRDPRQFEDPDELRLDRVNGRQHLGFGFGIHTCAGAPLARAEARVSLERILDRMADIRISEARARPGRRPPLRVHADLPAPRRSSTSTSSSRPIDAERAVTTVTHDRELGRAMSADDEQFRDELRAWLAEHPPPDVERRDDARGSRGAARVAADAARRTAGSASTGRSSTAGAARRSRRSRSTTRSSPAPSAPPLLGRAGISLVGPTLMAHGTEEQRRRWMPRILAGDDVWCQLFSEPDAGSDLAGLSTRAEQRGDVYVVTGQKVWSSYARFADWGIALVRTDPDAPPHKGISMLAIPMTAKGVEVRPLRQITGESEFNEVFLDDVEVPVENLIGPEHEGWRVANTTLANERGASFVWKEQVLHEVAIERLREDVRAPRAARRPASCASGSRSRGSRSRSSACTTSARSRGSRAARRSVPESSLVKLFWAGMSQRLYETAVAVLGPDALLMPGDDARRRRRAVGARAARVARQLDHGRHERDPAQHHRRAPARPAAGAESRDDRRRRRARPRRSRALRARRVSRTSCGRGCGPRRRSRTSRRPGSSRSGRSRSTPTSWRSRSSRCASRARRGSRCARPASVFPPSEMVVMLDPPRHGPVRRVANGRFTPRAVRERRDDIERIAVEILDDAAPAGASGELDFVERIAAPFPLAVIAWILGVPSDDWELLFRWTNEVIGKDDPEYRRPGETPGPDDQAGARRGARLLPAA